MADYPLIFIRQLKEMIGIESDYTSQDTRLQLCIDTASKTIESILGRKLSRATHEEYIATKSNSLKGYDIYGVGESGYLYAYKEVPLYLKAFPIDTTEDFNVYYDPQQLFGADTLLTAEEYILDPDNGVLIIKKAVGSYKRSLKIVYTAGYQQTVDTAGGVVENLNGPPQEYALANSLPADLVQAAIWQAQTVYDKQYGGNLNSRESRGEGSSNSSRYVNIHAIAPEVMAIIAMHKRPRYYVI